MMGQYREGDTIEQSTCRERTEEEQRAVEVCTVARVRMTSPAGGTLLIAASSLGDQGLKPLIAGGIIMPGMNVIVVEPGPEPAISPHAYNV